MSSRVIEIITSSFTKLLIPGLVYTIPITLISFAIGLLIAIVTALIRVKKIKLFNFMYGFLEEHHYLYNSLLSIMDYQV